MITHNLEISTLHLTSDTASRMKEIGEILIIEKLEEGWLVRVPDNREGLKGLPNDLENILRYARFEGCKYIKFDSQGEIDPMFPAWLGNELLEELTLAFK